MVNCDDYLYVENGGLFLALILLLVRVHDNDPYDIISFYLYL
jgi:hypothetical protein